MTPLIDRLDPANRRRLLGRLAELRELDHLICQPGAPATRAAATAGGNCHHHEDQNMTAEIQLPDQPADMGTCTTGGNYAAIASRQIREGRPYRRCFDCLLLEHQDLLRSVTAAELDASLAIMRAENAVIQAEYRAAMTELRNRAAEIAYIHRRLDRLYRSRRAFRRSRDRTPAGNPGWPARPVSTPTGRPEP